ncbi:MAG TPA: STAS domain-containing protein [Acidimicrobiales bacterium]|nr:STAS domain-containing protein [Acidimicrobiales bacterium]
MTVVDPTPASHAFGVELGQFDGRLVLRLCGDLDSQSAPELRDLIDELAIDGDTVLDLEELTFIDSSGLGCLFRLQQRVADAGGLVEAHGACPQVRHAIQMVQLNRVMAVLQ